MKNEKIDEMLELLWVIMENEGSKGVEVKKLPEKTGCFNPELIEKVGKRDVQFYMGEAEKEGLVEIKEDKAYFTRAGEARAKDIIRRHRLAERLFYDVLSVSENEMESEACKFEHILSESVTESVCVFLGHPPVCPHGKPIPPGKCCENYLTEVFPLTVRLADAEIGEEYKITFISAKRPDRLMKMSGLGIVPGSIIRIIQKKPSIVVQTGETVLALDDEIVKEVYVRHAKK